MMKPLVKTILIICVVVLSISRYCSAGAASEPYHLSSGQTVYVPVYSNVFSAPKQIPFNLATMLSIRNTDMTNSISATLADYYDTKGKLLRRYYQNPVTLALLESTHIYIPEDDKDGGFGANFIVRWNARKEINAPIIECVMIGAKSGRGISFIGLGQVIKEDTK